MLFSCRKKVKKLRAAVEYTTKPGVHQHLQTQLFFSGALAPMQRKLLKLFGPGLQVTNISHFQGGITCGAIEDPRKSSKAIDERVIINFRDKNGVIARFRDKNVYR